MIFVGYLLMSKQYKLYDPITKDIIVSLALTFAKDKFWEWPDEPEDRGPTDRKVELRQVFVSQRLGRLTGRKS